MALRTAARNASSSATHDPLLAPALTGQLSGTMHALPPAPPAQWLVQCYALPVRE
ncbi:hypothetical protein [Escherichia coli]|uniref:hypothetical protein n=1 Tax=Escherichia coli TaxID=562 RepID=UPI003D767810